MARHLTGTPLLIALGVVVGVCVYSCYKRVEKQERARQFYHQQINSTLGPPMSPTQQRQILEAMKRFPPPEQEKSSD